MCFFGGGQSKEPEYPAPPPAPPPILEQDAPDRVKRPTTANGRRAGTTKYRSTLSIPNTGSTRSGGLNI